MAKPCSDSQPALPNVGLGGDTKRCAYLKDEKVREGGGSLWTGVTGTCRSLTTTLPHVGDPTSGKRDFITTTSVTNRKQQQRGRG